jgi:hypothetical protein
MQMRDAVRSVAQHFPTAIVSGRGRDKVLLSSWFLLLLFLLLSWGHFFSGPLHLVHHGAVKGIFQVFSLQYFRVIYFTVLFYQPHDMACKELL